MAYAVTATVFSLGGSVITLDIQVKLLEVQLSGS
jgi:hypothetical protein